MRNEDIGDLFVAIESKTAEDVSDIIKRISTPSQIWSPFVRSPRTAECNSGVFESLTVHHASRRKTR